MTLRKILFFFLVLVLFTQQSLNAQIKIDITNGNSLTLLGGSPPPQSEDEKKYALILYNALVANDMDSIKMVNEYYYDMYINGDFIDIRFFSSMYWLCKCITADKKDLAIEMENPLSENLYIFFTENNFERLKDYLVFRYRLFNNIPMKDSATVLFYMNFLTYNAPNRNDWEKTSEIMSFLPLKKGDKVIDVGCGFGYYSFKLSKIVGEDGKVYATEIENLYVDHLKQIIDKSGVKNIYPLLTRPNYIGTRDSVDAVFLSELYHHFYGRMSDEDRYKLFNSMKKALKVNGYLIIEENLMSNERELASFYIDKRLIIAQLAYWGFTYIDYKEFSTKRYVLIFKHTNEKAKEQILYADEKSHDSSFFINIDSEKSLYCFYWSNFNILSDSKSDTMLAKNKNDEQIKLIIENIKYKKGQIIADLGSDPKYFTNRFSQLAGEEGMVYAIKFKKEYLKALKNFIEEESINNVEVIKGGINSFSIKKKADIIFMFMFYNIVYSGYTDIDRKSFIKSIIDNLNTDGKLIIVENGSENEEIFPIQEAYLKKELIEYQLSFYGFKLIDEVQISAHRYMLTFKLNGN